MHRKSLLGIPFALFLFFVLSGSTTTVNAAPILGWTFPNYTHCDIQVAVKITCPNGTVSRYSGLVGSGTASSASPGSVKLFSGPAYDPAVNPDCDIQIAVKIIGGATFTLTGTTGTGFSFQYCCDDGVPAGCSTADNCATVVWDAATKTVTAYPGC